MDQVFFLQISTSNFHLWLHRFWISLKLMKLNIYVWCFHESFLQSHKLTIWEFILILTLSINYFKKMLLALVAEEKASSNFLLLYWWSVTCVTSCQNYQNCFLITNFGYADLRFFSNIYWYSMLLFYLCL